MRNHNRISAAQELKLLLSESWAILTGETRNLAISLGFPVAAVIIIVWVAGKNMFLNCEDTKSACFILVCAAIWGGLFNSIQVVVKERECVRRDYISGAMRIEVYVISRALIQCMLCAVQSVLLCFSLGFVKLCYGNDLPDSGVIFGGPILEYYITVFLVMFSADAMGLLVSCVVKSEQLASQLSPYILILQLLFSGVLFPMKGAMRLVSGLMVSRWGMEALGTISDLNTLPLRLQEEFPMIPHNADDAFEYASSHLVSVWGILLLFVLISLIGGCAILHRVKYDRR